MWTRPRRPSERPLLERSSARRSRRTAATSSRTPQWRRSSQSASLIETEEYGSPRLLRPRIQGRLERDAVVLVDFFDGSARDEKSAGWRRLACRRGRAPAMAACRASTTRSGRTELLRDLKGSLVDTAATRCRSK